MNGKYKINIIYGSLNLEDLFVKTLLRELNIICHHFDKASLCVCSSLKEGDNI